MVLGSCYVIYVINHFWDDTCEVDFWSRISGFASLIHLNLDRSHTVILPKALPKSSDTFCKILQNVTGFAEETKVSTESSTLAIDETSTSKQTTVVSTAPYTPDETTMSMAGHVETKSMKRTEENKLEETTTPASVDNAAIVINDKPTITAITPDEIGFTGATLVTPTQTGPYSTPLTSTSRISTTTTVAESSVDVTHSEPTECRDYMERCPNYVSYCGQSQYVTEACPLSCGLCRRNISKMLPTEHEFSLATTVISNSGSNSDFSATLSTSVVSTSWLQNTTEYMDITSAASTIKTTSIGSAPDSKKCEDMSPSCPRYAAYCDKSDSLKLACRFTCGLCGEDQEIAAAESTYASTKESYTITPNAIELVEATRSGISTDQTQYMDIITDQIATEEDHKLKCEDELESCPDYVMYCENSYYMRKNCPFTCGTCDDHPATTTAISERTDMSSTKNPTDDTLVTPKPQVTGYTMTQPKTENTNDSVQEMGSCHDVLEECSEYSEYCSSSKSVKIACPFTCGVCSKDQQTPIAEATKEFKRSDSTITVTTPLPPAAVVTSKGIESHLQVSTRQQSTSSTFQTVTDSVIQPFSQSNVSTSTTGQYVTIPTTIITTLPVATEDPQPCEDTLNNCAELSGYCGSYEYIRKNCPYSCGMCSKIDKVIIDSMQSTPSYTSTVSDVPTTLSHQSDATTSTTENDNVSPSLNKNVSNENTNPVNDTVNIINTIDEISTYTGSLIETANSHYTDSTPEYVTTITEKHFRSTPTINIKTGTVAFGATASSMPDMLKPATSVGPSAVNPTSLTMTPSTIETKVQTDKSATSVAHVISPTSSLTENLTKMSAPLTSTVETLTADTSAITNTVPTHLTSTNSLVTEASQGCYDQLSVCSSYETSLCESFTFRDYCPNRCGLCIVEATTSK